MQKEIRRHSTIESELAAIRVALNMRKDNGTKSDFSKLRDDNENENARQHDQHANDSVKLSDEIALIKEQMAKIETGCARGSADVQTILSNSIW